MFQNFHGTKSTESSSGNLSQNNFILRANHECLGRRTSIAYSTSQICFNYKEKTLDQVIAEKWKRSLILPKNKIRLRYIRSLKLQTLNCVVDSDFEYLFKYFFI